MRFLLVLLTYFLSTSAKLDNCTVLQPIKQGQELGIVFVQGASISVNAYLPLIKEIQAQTPLALYISLPEFPNDTPAPVISFPGIREAKNALYEAGLPRTAKTVLAGHSLGAATSEMFIDGSPEVFDFLILMADSISREYRNEKSSPVFDVNTLTIGGTLDGQYRITRMAESVYHQFPNKNYTPPDDDNEKNFPIVLIEGMSHMQFASGTPPDLVLEKDFQPAISYDSAHFQIANAISLFLRGQLNIEPDQQSLSDLVKTSREISAPIIAAFEMEAFHHYQPSCDSDSYEYATVCPYYSSYPGSKSEIALPDPCYCGVPWVRNFAQEAMANLSGISWEIVDSIHSSDENHEPHIWSEPCSLTGQSCTINVTTSSFQSYNRIYEIDDIGTFPLASEEIQAKMVSRQSLWNTAGGSGNFDDLDGTSNICKQINEQSYKWALEILSSEASARFAEYGENYVFDDDKITNSESSWARSSLKFTESRDKSQVTVTSSSYATQMEGDDQGYHFCKLLSPAMAVEWMYIDGLRSKLGLSAE